jgi:uncharacterized protein VirK/YbjX
MNLEVIEQMKDLHPMEIMKKLSKNEYALFPNFMEGNQFLYFTFSLKEETIVSYISKKTNVQYTFICDEKDRIQPPIAVYKDFFISVEYHEEGSPNLLFYTIKQ